LQNARGRLQTMLKNPSKRSNANSAYSLRTNDENRTAQQAALLAERALNYSNLSNRLLLSLIFAREKPGNQTQPKTPTEATQATAHHPYHMPVGFQSPDFPPLDDVLKSNRRLYYELSMDPSIRQTTDQLSFNNRLVAVIRQVAARHYWVFEHSTNNTKIHHWTDKALRDRIRCY
jgi:hypothetical protein